MLVNEKDTFLRRFGVTVCALFIVSFAVFWPVSSSQGQDKSSQQQEVAVSSQNTAVVTSRYCCDNPSRDGVSLSDSNSLEIVIHRDPRMPTVVASLVFNVGAADVPLQKSGIVALISANIINKNMRESLKKAGIDCSVIARDSYTEIRAHMHPKRLKKFFEICKDVAKSISVDPEELENQKKSLLVFNDMENCDQSNALQDNIRAQYIPQTIFNGEALKSLTVADIKRFFEENYKDQIVLINLCGDVDWVPTLEQKKKFLERYHNTPKRAERYRIPESRVGCEIALAPNIRVESKHNVSSLRYFYLVNDPKDKQILLALIDLMNYEMFRYFRKAHSVVHGAFADLVFSRDDEVLSVFLWPKMDVSLRDLRDLYEVFIERFAKIAPKKEVLQKIAGRKKISFDVLLGDLSEINSYITSMCMSHTFNDRCYPQATLEVVDPEEVRKLFQKIFGNQMIFTVTTRYRPDR